MLCSILLLTCLLSWCNFATSCSLRINEVNADSINKPIPNYGNAVEMNEYIELIAVNCLQGEIPEMSSYVLLIVKEFDKGTQLPTVVLSADLSNSQFSALSPYFVIGSSYLSPPANLSFDNPSVMYLRKRVFLNNRNLQLSFVYNNLDLTDVLENGNNVPIAIMLLRRDISTYDVNKLLIKMPSNSIRGDVYYNSVALSDELQNIIFHNIVDMCVYARKHFVTKCTFFQRVNQFKWNMMQHKIASQFNTPNNEELSINRCPVIPEDVNLLFMNTLFRLGKMTPFMANDCTGPHFTLDNEINILKEDEQKEESKTSFNIVNQCSESTRNAKPRFVVSEKQVVDHRNCLFEKSKSAENPAKDIYCTCTNPSDSITLVDNDIAHLQSKLQFADVAQTSIEQLHCDKPYTSLLKLPNQHQPWQDISHFKTEWPQLILKHQGRYVTQSLLRNENRAWLSYLFNSNNPQMSTFQCRICHSYYLKSKDKSNLSPLASDEGFFEKNYERMRHMLGRHALTAYHHKAVIYQKEQYLLSLKSCQKNLNDLQSQELSMEHESTLKMVRTVYMEVKNNIPFDTHEEMVKLQKMNGISLGAHHYSAFSATAITASISKNMHRRLVNYITKYKQPLAIILDSATDSSNRNFLFLYLRMLENNIPKSHFFRSLHLKHETPEELLNVINTAISEDGLTDTFFPNLYAFASDGHPSYMGSNKGLAKLLNDSTSNNLFIQHCMSHKLQLAASHSFMNVDSVKDKIDDIVTTIFTFYSNKSFKRKQSLIKTAEQLGNSFYAMSRLYPTRWAAAHFQAFMSLYKNYAAILLNMDEISKSKDFAQDVQSKAQGLRKIMIDGKFFTTFIFIVDVLHVLKSYSLKFQESTATVIGKEILRLSILRELSSLKTINGPLLQNVIKNARCLKNNIWKPCSSADMDMYVFKILFNGDFTVFTKHDQRSSSKWTELQTLRIKLIDALLNEINSYFPEGTYEMFDVFLPSNLPTIAADIKEYSTNINKVAIRFGYIPSVTASQFNKVLASILMNEKNQFCILRKNNDPVEFWSYFMSSAVVEWENDVLHLLKISLTIPVGSADIERGFSVMNYVNTEKRYSLTKEHIEDIVRINVNGPALENFDALAYALRWRVEGHIDTNDARNVRKKTNSIPASSIY